MEGGEAASHNTLSALVRIPALDQQTRIGHQPYTLLAEPEMQGDGITEGTIIAQVEVFEYGSYEPFVSWV